MTRVLVLLGGSGNIGKLLLSKPYIWSAEYHVITCGRKPINGYKNYYWQLGDKIPINDIKESLENIVGVTIIYCAISWPKASEDIIYNIIGLKKILLQHSDYDRFIYISSAVVTTNSNSLYSNLKRKEEKLCLEFNSNILRIGMVYSNSPFGQSLFFYNIAKFFYFVPVPYPYAKVNVSNEDEICSSLANAIKTKEHGCIELVGKKLYFIKVIRSLLIKYKVSHFCFPVPNFIINIIFIIVARVAPNSWISQRLQGLKAFINH